MVETALMTPRPASLLSDVLACATDTHASAATPSLVIRTVKPSTFLKASSRMAAHSGLASIASFSVPGGMPSPSVL